MIVLMPVLPCSIQEGSWYYAYRASSGNICAMVSIRLDDAILLGESSFHTLQDDLPHYCAAHSRNPVTQPLEMYKSIITLMSLPMSN